MSLLRFFIHRGTAPEACASWERVTCLREIPFFVGGIGRTDLPGASMQEFMKSIKERLLTLPEDTIVWPGHNYGFTPSSTIGNEKKTNPFLSGEFM